MHPVPGHQRERDNCVVAPRSRNTGSQWNPASRSYRNHYSSHWAILEQGVMWHPPLFTWEWERHQLSAATREFPDLLPPSRNRSLNWALRLFEVFSIASWLFPSQVEPFSTLKEISPRCKSVFCEENIIHQHFILTTQQIFISCSFLKVN